MLPIWVPAQSLSKRERAATPNLFAKYLIALVDPVAVLWVADDTIYRHYGLDLWGVERDANNYPGPGPVIAHPPCGPWGRYRNVSKESQSHGIRGMELVHRYGGVVEQPIGSRLFKEYGDGGTVYQVNQGDYGHQALKPTLLYVVRRAS